MTPKENAEKLVTEFFKSNIGYGPREREIAKKNALIAVEFARQEFKDHCISEFEIEGSPNDHFDIIKQEINKL